MKKVKGVPADSIKTLYKNSGATKTYWEEDWDSRDYKKMLEKELYNHTFRATIDTFISQNRIHEGQKVLDIGCGWGRIAIGLLARFPTLKVSGIDISEEAISRAPSLIEKETGISDVDLHVGSAEELPFADNSFDCITSSRVFQYIQDPQKAMQEVMRVLKAHGRVTISVPNKYNPLRYISYHTQLLTSRDLSDWMTKANLTPISTGSMVYFPPSILAFSEDSWWVHVDRVLSKMPGVGRVGGLAWATGEKLG